MTREEVISSIVTHAGHERFRWLCSDDNPDVHQRDAYRRLVDRIVADPDSIAVDSSGGSTADDPPPHGIPLGGCCG